MPTRYFGHCTYLTKVSILYLMATIVWDIDVIVFEKNLVVVSACNIKIPGIPGLGVIIGTETAFLICSSLVVGRLNRRKKMMNNRFCNFPTITVAVY